MGSQRCPTRLSPITTDIYIWWHKDRALPYLRDKDCFHVPCWGINDCDFVHKTQVWLMWHLSSSMITYLKIFTESSPMPGIGNTAMNRRYNPRAGIEFSEGGHPTSEWARFPKNAVLWGQATEAACLCYRIILAIRYKINTKKTMPGHIIIKPLKTEDREEIL